MINFREVKGNSLLFLSLQTRHRYRVFRALGSAGRAIFLVPGPKYFWGHPFEVHFTIPEDSLHDQYSNQNGFLS